MRCRRGTSRGQVIRQPSYSTSGSTSQSSEYLSGRFPSTRSGRGFGSGQSNYARGSPHIPVSPLPLPVQSHTAQLRITCALCHSTMIAKITFEFQADSVTEAVLAPEAPLEKNINVPHLIPPSDSRQSKEPCSSGIPDTSLPAGPSDTKCGGSVDK